MAESIYEILLFSGRDVYLSLRRSLKFDMEERMESGMETPVQYIATRPDGLNPEMKFYLSGLQTWTRSPEFALKGDQATMSALILKIRHAFPGLTLEKEETRNLSEMAESS